MALSSTESRVADGITVSALVGGTAAMGLAFVSPHNVTFAAVSTGAYALGGAALGARYLYDQMGQGIVVWQTRLALQAAINACTAQELEKLATRLQRLEYRLDHRIDVIGDSKNARAQVALGSWVMATRTLLQKSQLFEVSQEVRTPSGKLPAYWPEVTKTLSSRLDGYERMLDGTKLKDLEAPIIDDGYGPSI